MKERKCESSAIQFIIGLNDNFYVVKTHVLLMESLSYIKKIYSLVSHEESSIVPTHVLDDSNMLENTFDAKRAHGRGRGSLAILTQSNTHFNMHGHTFDFSY